jgi:hypothetical protein
MHYLPKCHALDDSTIAIGQKIHFPNKAPKLDEEFHSVLNHAGQHLHFTVELGTSIDEIMASEEPILKSLSKGFRVSHTQCLIGNLKKVFVELSKSEKDEHKMIAT